MAKSTVEMKVDVVSDIFTICSVRCNAFDCINHKEGSTNCNLKHIEMESNGSCSYYETKLLK